MGSASQDDSGGNNDAAQGSSAAVFHATDDTIPQMGGASLSMQNKGKKYRHSSLGSGNLSKTCSPKVARVRPKAKGKQVQKVGSWGVHPASPETFDKSSKEGRVQEEETCMCTVDPVQHFADDTHCLLQAETMTTQKSIKMSLRL